MANQSLAGEWIDNSTHLCFLEEFELLEGPIQAFTCGAKDDCSLIGLVLPIVNEITWPVWFRALLYLTALIYCCIAMFIVADIFMCSIDSITSKTREVIITGENGIQKHVKIPIWNGAVANLVLMSLGPRVAPLILLSLIGTLGNGLEQDRFGPSLIVGSGAFNLFVISAVSVCVIPPGETRRVEKYSVFCVNMFFSIFSYLWLVLILMVNTVDKVDVWEAVLTLAFVPLVVILNYVADKGWLDKIFCQTRREVCIISFLHFTNCVFRLDTHLQIIVQTCTDMCA